MQSQLKSLRKRLTEAEQREHAAAAAAVPATTGTTKAAAPAAAPSAARTTPAAASNPGGVSQTAGHAKTFAARPGLSLGGKATDSKAATGTAAASERTGGQKAARSVGPTKSSEDAPAHAKVFAAKYTLGLSKARMQQTQLQVQQQQQQQQHGGGGESNRGGPKAHRRKGAAASAASTATQPTGASSSTAAAASSAAAAAPLPEQQIGLRLLQTAFAPAPATIPEESGAHPAPPTASPPKLSSAVPTPLMPFSKPASIFVTGGGGGGGAASAAGARTASPPTATGGGSAVSPSHPRGVSSSSSSSSPTSRVIARPVASSAYAAASLRGTAVAGIGIKTALVASGSPDGAGASHPLVPALPVKPERARSPPSQMFLPPTVAMYPGINGSPAARPAAAAASAAPRWATEGWRRAAATEGMMLRPRRSSFARASSSARRRWGASGRHAAHRTGGTDGRRRPRISMSDCSGSTGRRRRASAGG